MKTLMLGNEAAARGMYEAGCSFVSSYPGTPSTEITECAAKYPEIYAEWAPNEKVAMEAAFGASLAGYRSFCGMKHVGLNVAADPLFTLSYTGVRGGLVIGVADDAGMHSSQNEQDSRHYAIAAKLPMLEPSDAAESLAFAKLAYEISEKFDTPVLLKMCTRVAHAQSVVEPSERQAFTPVPYEKNIAKFVMMPACAKARHPIVEQRTLALQAWAETAEINRMEDGADHSIGLIASSTSYQYVKEVCGDRYPVLKLGMVNPLPVKKIQAFAKNVEKVIVVEELDGIIEAHCRAIGVQNVTGKELFGCIGEFSQNYIAEKLGMPVHSGKKLDEAVPARPPVMCAGCPHRGLFYTLKKNKLTVLGDIGCYALDMVLNGMGYPKPLTVTGFLSDYFGKADDYKYKDVFGVDDFAAGFVRLEGGLTIDFKTAWAMNVDTMGNTVVLGTKAGLKIPSSGHWGSIDAPLKIYRNIGEAEVETVVPMLEEPEEGVFYWKVRKFLDAVKEGGEAPVPTSQAIYNQAILDGLYRSAQIGHEIELEIPEV